ncbi:MAG: HNH endonuclease [Lachnospiraceae bacterium]|nr:HNH endonuclease [Lachnospiraceae bacterium]
MPYKPKKPCSYPGCPKLTDGRYCEEHKKVMNKRYEMYKRDPMTKKRYGNNWQKIRKLYVSLHPLCEECLKNKIASPVEHVHHIKPLSEGGTNDFDNLMSLCKSCHSRVHAKRGDYWKNAPGGGGS